MMAECTGCPKVIACRHNMIAQVHAVLDKHLPRDATEAKAALREMWHVGSDGRLRDWAAIDAIADGYGEALNADLDHDQTLADHLTRMRNMRDMMSSQTGPECAALGCLTKGWRQLIKVECDMTNSGALQMLTDIQAAMRAGIRKVWLSRNDTRAKWAQLNKHTIWKRRDEALEQLVRRYKQRGRDIPDGLQQHVRNMRRSRLAKWVARQERQQRCLTEYFAAEPRTEEEQQHKRRHDAVINVARLTRRRTENRTQLVLTGNLNSSTDGSPGKCLAFSRHIPAHTPTGAPNINGKTAMAKRGVSGNASPLLHTSAPKCMAQMRIAPSSSGLGIAKMQDGAMRKKRRGRPAARADRDTAKRLRTHTHQADASCTGKRKALEKAKPQAHSSSGVMKRKHEARGRQSCKSGQKRKSAAGTEHMQSVAHAHCHGSSTNCDTHSAGSSMRVGHEAAVDVLSTTTMRPVD